MPKTIFLVRHGETAFNSEGEERVRGRINIPLNDLGMRHAKQAGEFLAKEKIQAIYYSEILRAKQTAEAVYEHHREAKFVEEPLVIDIDWGSWQEKTFTEAFGSPDGGEFKRDPSKLEIPNGESFYQVLDRIKKMFHKLMREPEDTVCLVTHGAVLNLLACYVFQAPLSKFWTFYNGGCSVSKLVMTDPDNFSLKYWNEMQHIK